MNALPTILTLQNKIGFGQVDGLRFDSEQETLFISPATLDRDRINRSSRFGVSSVSPGTCCGLMNGSGGA